LNQRGLYQLDM